MTRRGNRSIVTIAFEDRAQRIAIADIHPLRVVTSSVRGTPKFAQIAASIKEVGVIEPIVVARSREEPGKYLLLDGHLRLEILKTMGESDVTCLVSTDDEAFTYNRRINRLATIQQHRMILNAIKRGVPEAKVARALNIEITTLQQRKHLLNGICDEAVDILKDKEISISTFGILRKMTSLRQIESAELMVAMNRFTSNYAKSLLAGTPQSQLVSKTKTGAVKGLTDEQMLLMERESANLEREFKVAAQSYGTDHLDLVLAKGYLSKLLSNAPVLRYLAKHHQDLLVEFQKLADGDPALSNNQQSAYHADIKQVRSQASPGA